ncbi:MAG: electron transfer flavoprotein subunit alpha [Pseudomonadota bacterium]|jgi:electron transfer flavoprotein alpha subunit
MSKILVVAEQAQGKVKSATWSAITFAKQAATLSSGSFDILVLGASASSAAKELTGFGAGEVRVCEDASLENYLAERYAPTVAAVAQGYSVVCATASSFGKDLMPRAAARLDAAYAGDCSGVSADGGQLRYKRPMFAGNAFGHLTLGTQVQVVTVRQSEFGVAVPSGGVSAISTVPLTPPGKAAERVEFISMDQVQSARPELSDAQVVLSGGRALKDKFFEVLEPLADQLKAAIGASRAACDAGYAPGDYQVGQTGKIVAPKLYLAVGISGAIQHVAGMKGSKTIVAINKDPDAPIFQIADYGLVADLFDAVPELTSALKARA